MSELVVIGLGHIGGSLALAAKERRLFTRVVGVETDAAHRSQAGIAGLADVVLPALEGAVERADLVIVAVPPRETANVAVRALAAAPKAVVSDVASVKARVVDEVSRRSPKDAGRFVGAHPMAGTTGKGPSSADAGLFEGRSVWITPAGADTAAVAAVEALWHGLGAHTVREDAKAHDRLVAALSHLPHVLAWALVRAAAEICAPEGGDERTGAVRAARFSGPSWESSTRVAASDAELWTEILTLNAPAALDAVAAFRAKLEAVESALAQARDGDADMLHAFLDEAQSLKKEGAA